MIMEKKDKKNIPDPCDKGLDCKLLTIESTDYRTLYTSKFQNRKKWKPVDPEEVLAVIPGTIKEIHVEEGQWVEEGDSLLTLEAMKMRNVIVAPVTGKVSHLQVEAEQRVPKGYLMLKVKAG